MATTRFSIVAAESPTVATGEPMVVIGGLAEVALWWPCVLAHRGHGLFEFSF